MAITAFVWRMGLPGVGAETGTPAPANDQTAQTRALAETLFNRFNDGTPTAAEAKLPSDPDQERKAAALHEAIRTNNINTVRSLLDQGTHVESRLKTDNAWPTPLHSAIIAGREEIAKLLIERGADITTRTRQDVTPLSLTITHHRGNIAKMLVERKVAIEPYLLINVILHNEFRFAELLIDGGVDINVCQIETGYKYVPLGYAIDRRNERMAALLINKGARLDEPDSSGRTPLQAALWITDWPARTNIIDRMVKRGVTIDIFDAAIFDTPIHLEPLLTKDPTMVNARKRITGATPLQLAARYGRAPCVQALLNHGADPNIRDNEGSAAIHYAIAGHLPRAVNMMGVSVGHHTPPESPQANVDTIKTIIDMLITKGADINDMGNGKTGSPLHTAINMGFTDGVVLLIEKGGKLDITNSTGITALHSAAWNGRDDIVRILIKAGANLNTKDKEGRTPYDLATIAGHGKMMDRLCKDMGLEVKASDNVKAEARCQLLTRWAQTSTSSEAIMDQVAQDPALALATNRWGGSLLHNMGMVTFFRKPESARVDFVKFLLNHGAKVNLPDKDGNTPLHRMMFQQQPNDVLSLLIANGADIEAGNDEGNTPLHEAAESAHVNIVGFLLDKGARIDAQNTNGETPLHTLANCYYANLSTSNHLTTIRLLVERGADPAAKDKRGYTPAATARNANNRYPDIIAELSKPATKQPAP